MSGCLYVSVAQRSSRHMTDFITVWALQSARMRAAGVGKDFKENPNLRDNWTDAEGYYSKCCLPPPRPSSDVTRVDSAPCL